MRYLGLLAALVGCGGGDDTAPSGTGSPTGGGTTPDLCVTPGLIDFGQALTPTTLEVVLRNKGGVPVTVDAITVTGGRYQVETALPITVAAGDEGTFDLTFGPNNATPSAEDLTATADGAVVGFAKVKGNNCVRGLPEAYDLDSDGVLPCGGDCRPEDPAVHPGAPEVPGNGTDDDCDGSTDEPARDPALDDDGDGFCDAASCSDGSQGLDCDDENDQVFPGALEINNRRDDDCNGVVDNGYNTTDEDGDGFVEEGGDCDDLDATVHPCAADRDPARDADCDGVNGA